MSSDEPAVQVSGLSKVYHIYDRPADRLKQMLWGNLRHKFYGREFWALKDVSFDVPRGAMLGILGRNGSGKSTLLQCLAGILQPTTGSSKVSGRVAALLELGSGFNPEFTGRENVHLYGSILQISRQEMESRFDAIAAFADIGEFIDQPVKTYSSGMVVRLAFAVSTQVDPEILIVDEALAVGDIAFQQKCFRRLAEMRERQLTVLLVTHDLSSVARYCSSTVVLQQGRVIGSGNSAEMIELYRKSLTGLSVETAPSKVEVKPLEVRSFPRNSNCIEYGGRDAQIVGWGIFDQHGKPVRVITDQMRTKIVVQVAFKRDCLAPIIGYFIKDLRGTEITGTNTMFAGKDIGFRAAGNIVTVSFEQTLSLAPGHYSLCIGCSEYLSDELVAHHRLYDVYLFESGLHQRFVGIVNPRSEVAVGVEDHA